METKERKTIQTNGVCEREEVAYTFMHRAAKLYVYMFIFAFVMRS